MKVLLEEKRKIILALLLGAALLFFAVIIYNTYDAYTNMVVEQQQQHLLLISRAVAQNMELYISDQLRDIRSVTQTPENWKKERICCGIRVLSIRTLRCSLLTADLRCSPLPNISGACV